MIPAPWPRSILPADRDDRFNILMDGICSLYRGLQGGDELAGVSVRVRDGAGRAFLIIRTGGVVRRVPVADWVDATELECERSEEKAC